MRSRETFRSSDPEFQGTIGRTYLESDPWWPAPPMAPEGTPDVILVVLDDVGFASLGCYGSEIETPHMDALAARGLRYNNFHATPMCSPTRACLLTGRNHHAVGMSLLSSCDEGFPGKRGSLSRSAATAAEMLRDLGYNTMCAGKWHLAQADNTTAAGPFDQWPLGRGFERYYGFLDPLTDQFYPELVSDNHRIEPPSTPEEGYHLSADLVTQAIQFITDQKSAAPGKPYFLYLAFGATHSPHQAPGEYLEKYRGRYDSGWDEVRAERYRRQLAMGIIPGDTQLAPLNKGVRPWADLTDDERRVAARLQEAYAAMLDHTDAQIGRLVAHLERLGRLDNTLIFLVSDNGASQEGGAFGAIDTSRYDNLEPEDLSLIVSRLDDIGSPRAHNNYPWGWAQVANTPLKRYKQETYAGGVRVPAIISWPRTIRDVREIRPQFHHAIDVLPTILDVLGARAPETYRGVGQLPLHGVSMAYTWGDAVAASRHRTQYFELRGHRGIWRDGWKAVGSHERRTSFDDDVWELYHLDSDFSECVNRAAEYPEKLAELQKAWWQEATQYEVLPLDDRLLLERPAFYDPKRPLAPSQRKEFVFFGGMSHYASVQAPAVFNRSYEIVARASRESASASPEGVIVSHGSLSSGYSLYVKDRRLVFDYNSYGTVYRIDGDAQFPTDGAYEVRFVFEKTGDVEGVGSLYLCDRLVAKGPIPKTHRYMIAWQGLDIGRDALCPVTDAYVGAFQFTDRLDTVSYRLGDDGSRKTYEPMD